MAKAAKAKAKPKQDDLPGMEERDIKELVEAAELCVDKKHELKLAKNAYNGAEDALKTAMRKNKRIFYTYRGITISLDTTEKVKVQIKDMDAKADIRNTRQMVTEIKAAAKPPTPEPTTEESMANAQSFIGNRPVLQLNAAPPDVIDAELIVDAEAAPESDDFTAEMCGECRAIDGAHALGCSKSNGLTSADYLAYAKHNNIKSAASWARKWELSREKDALILAWKEEGMEKRAERFTKPGPKKTKSDKPKRTSAQASR